MIIDSVNILEKIAQLRNHPSIVDKMAIEQTYRHLGNSVKNSVYFKNNAADIKLGDDAAAILQPDGSHLLFASEGIVEDFLMNDPWFAGYSAIMVNISDICAMGGLPIAVTDTLYVKGQKNSEEIWQGMLAASINYGVPIVGGHTCYHSENNALSVSILGKATQHVLTSFDALPGEELLLAIDQRGAYYKDYPFWNASTTTDSEILQKRVTLPYEIANQQLSSTAKDISMGGIIGTICMLMNTSNIGIEIDLDAITKPVDIPWNKWLVSFPSYGYLLTCKTKDRKNIQTIFFDNGIQCDHIGHIQPRKELTINYQGGKLKF
jgi:AIR synthase-related protein